ncbi:MAG: ATP-binding protein [Hydrogenovibrio sp.]
MEQILLKARQLYAALQNRKLPTYEREILAHVEASSARILGIYGSRGVGKTTLMLQWLKKQNLPISETLYISCDHPAFSDIDLFDMAQYFEQYGVKVLVIDEIHQARGFEQALKSIYDYLSLKVVFSGSSAISLTSPDFSRRFSMFALSQLSFKESLELQYGMPLPVLSLTQITESPMDHAVEIIQALGHRKVLPLFDAYLQKGAYPFYFEDPGNYQQRLADTINLVVQMELGSLFHIQHDKIDLLKKLLVVICRSQPLELSIEKITTSVELSKPTLYKFLNYLERGELVRQVPHELKKYKTIRKADTLYLYHPNLFSALCLAPEIGTLREAFFASQLGRNHRVEFCDQGDFLIDETFVFEIGGRGKDFSQLKNQTRPSYLALDGMEVGSEPKIPLWLFGFLPA